MSGTIRQGQWSWPVRIAGAPDDFGRSRAEEVSAALSSAVEAQDGAPLGLAPSLAQ